MKEPVILKVEFVFMAISPFLSFGHAGFDVDLVLLPAEDEELDHEHDQGPLRRHVEAEREIHERNLVEVFREPVDDERENEPDDQVNDHQPLRSLPMNYLLGTSRAHMLISSPLYADFLASWQRPS
jgi:hypothetical protein